LLPGATPTPPEGRFVLEKGVSRPGREVSKRTEKKFFIEGKKKKMMNYKKERMTPLKNGTLSLDKSLTKPSRQKNWGVVGPGGKKNGPSRKGVP